MKRNSGTSLLLLPGIEGLGFSLLLIKINFEHASLAIVTSCVRSRFIGRINTSLRHMLKLFSNFR